MDTLQTLERRMDTVASVRSILRTLKALSAASIRSFERAAWALDDYEETVVLGLTAVLPRVGWREPAKLHGALGLVVLGTDHGLCGRFNDEVVTRARAIAQRRGPPRAVGVLGGRLEPLAREAFGPDVERLPLPGAPDEIASTIAALLSRLDDWRASAGVERIRAVYQQREGGHRSTVRDVRALPLPEALLRQAAARAWPGRGRPFFRMESARLVRDLVRQYVYVTLYRACAHSLAAEHDRRLRTIQGAERGIDERSEALRQQWRTRRQADITAELLDVVSGYETATAGERT